MKSETSPRIPGAGRTKQLNRLQLALKIKMKDLSLLDRARTHRSFSNESGKTCIDNERLEYLGDSVLALVINEYLFKRYSDYLEGDLAKIKSTVVSESVLYQVAKDLNLGEFLLLGKGEDHSGGRTRPSILANTVEAVIGALYLDSGLKRSRECVLSLLKKHVEQINRMEYMRDPKTALQEYVQKKYKEKPRYDVVEESGPDHLKEFTVRLMVCGREVLCGKGSSKRRAEMDAARIALGLLHEGSLNI